MSLFLDLLHRTLLDIPYTSDGVKVAPNNPFPTRCHTMVGDARLRNVRRLCERALSLQVPGDFMECGIWRGGCGIMMRGVIANDEFEKAAYSGRSVWLADSFQGVPPPSLPQDAGINLHVFPLLAVSLAEVTENFRRYGLLDDRVKFLPGWFKDTLRSAPIESLSVLRLDGDLYESTWDCLTHLYHKLSPGGYIIIDDYNAIEACKLAVTEFRESRKISDEIILIDEYGVYWRKGV